MRKILFLLTILPTLLTSADNRYEPNWTSLSRHHIPQWLKDAKFGIYCHWGLQSVKNLPGNEDKHLREIIPLFKAEKFNADEWADLFVAAGAQFAGAVAWHGSGFLHWDSELTPWNSVDMGPGIDIVGELEKAVKRRNLKFLTSYHFGYHYGFFHWDDPEYRNPAYVGLYGQIHDTTLTDVVRWKNHIEKQAKCGEEYTKEWLAKMKEAVNNYQPDLVWIDVSFGGTLRAYNKAFYRNGKLISEDEIYLSGIREKYQQEFIAWYYNQAIRWGKEVEFTYKVHDVPPGIGMRDIENGLLAELAYDHWMTDLDMKVHGIGDIGWFYSENCQVKSADYIIDALVDVVSKNGRMLLNVPPKADGSFSPDIVNELREVGQWLRVNGEAIYGAMPWVVYGEGPTEPAKPTHYGESTDYTRFTARDIRFTVNGEYLYAICLGWPGAELEIRALGSRGKLYENEIEKIELLGWEKPLRWQQSDYKLTIQLPSQPVNPYALVFKITRR